MGLEGNLKDFDLSDILQLIQLGKKTGALVVQAGGEEGTIFFNDGAAVHAKAGDVTGDHAVNRILRWHQGSFAFKPDEATAYRSIQLPIQHLVLDAARQIDEWQDIQRLIPSLDMVLAIEERPPAGTEDIKLQPMEWRVLSLVDGSRPIRAIVKDGHLADFDACKVLYGLLSSGLLKAVQAAKPEPPPPAAAPKPAIQPAAPPPKPEEKKGWLFGKKK
ncbi:MAG: DUF4388 domain-containing protein [Candidatus Edwardsbacteria bacterium]|nr:DUF4388 domain-containing protein [Candidatus Edwardsbacteria bacterium]